MREDDLRLYGAMSRLPLVGRSYRAKVLLAAFLGTHVPLLALAGHLARSSGIGRAATLRVLAVGLLALPDQAPRGGRGGPRPLAADDARRVALRLPSPRVPRVRA